MRMKTNKKDEQNVGERNRKKGKEKRKRKRDQPSSRMMSKQNEKARRKKGYC